MSHRALPWTVLAAAGLLAGCGTLSPLELVEGDGCTTDVECKADRICVAGACVFPEEVPRDGGYEPGPVDAGPEDDAGPGPVDAGPGPIDAGPGPVDGGGPIDAGTPDGGEAGGIGSACQDPFDCEFDMGWCVTEGDGFPGGLCVQLGCWDGCPDGAVCLTSADFDVCVPTCQSDADCREGYGCSTEYGEPMCLPAQGGGETPVGGACEVSTECAGETGVCHTDWPGGYCIVTGCLTGLAACDQGSMCWDVGDAEGACLERCAADQACTRDGYVCLLYGRRRGACVPRCDLADICNAGQVCNAQTGLCE